MPLAEDGSTVPEGFWNPVAPADDGDLASRVRRLEEALSNLSRVRSEVQRNLRDLTDCGPMRYVTDGQFPAYVKATGRFEPSSPAPSTPFAIPPFVLAGSLYVATSPRWYPEQTVTVDRLFGSLVAAGSTSTVVRVRKNGSVVGTLTITASDFAEGVGFTATTFTGPETDYMTVEVQTVGAGASDLTVQVS